MPERVPAHAPGTGRARPDRPVRHRQQDRRRQRASPGWAPRRRRRSWPRADQATRPRSHHGRSWPVMVPVRHRSLRGATRIRHRSGARHRPGDCSRPLSRSVAWCPVAACRLGPRRGPSPGALPGTAAAASVAARHLGPCRGPLPRPLSRPVTCGPAGDRRRGLCRGPSPAACRNPWACLCRNPSPGALSWSVAIAGRRCARGATRSASECRTPLCRCHLGGRLRRRLDDQRQLVRPMGEPGE